MALTASQKRQLARRTTDTSQARLMATFTGGVPAAPSAPSVTSFGGPVQPPAAPQAPRAAATFAPDATYLAEAAQRQFARQTQLNELQAQSEHGRTIQQEAIRRLMESVGEQRQQTSQSYNKAGLFYSGQLGKALGGIETAVARQRADIQGNFDAEERAREAARNALLQGAPLEEAAALAANVERQLGTDAGLAEAGALAPTPVPAPAQAAPKRDKTRVRNGRREYQWPNGTWHTTRHRGN